MNLDFWLILICGILILLALIALVILLITRKKKPKEEMPSDWQGAGSKYWWKKMFKIFIFVTIPALICLGVYLIITMNNTITVLSERLAEQQAALAEVEQHVVIKEAEQVTPEISESTAFLFDTPEQSFPNEVSVQTVIPTSTINPTPTPRLTPTPIPTPTPTPIPTLNIEPLRSSIHNDIWTYIDVIDDGLEIVNLAIDGTIKRGDDCHTLYADREKLHALKEILQGLLFEVDNAATKEELNAVASQIPWE